MGLTLGAVSISLPDRTLIEPLDLVVDGGECVTVMGPSGCGKSTLLSYIAGTLDGAFEATGRITIDDVDVTPLPPEARRIGILFQDDLLFPHLSVADNLSFALSSAMRSRANRARAIAQALAEAELDGFADRDPATLSGGQRARVAVMRALLSDPRVLLLDEPFNKLDRKLRHGFRRFVFDHAVRRGLPVLLVTHDAEDATAAGGRVVTL